MMDNHARPITPRVEERCRIVTGGEFLAPNVHTTWLKLIYSACRGPGFRTSDFESNRMIGEAQYLGAQRVMNSSMSLIKGAVKSVHTYLNMCVLPIFLQCRCLIANIASCSSIAGLTIPSLYWMEPQCPHVLLPWVGYCCSEVSDIIDGGLTNRLFYRLRVCRWNYVINTSQFGFVLLTRQQGWPWGLRFYSRRQFFNTTVAWHFLTEFFGFLTVLRLSQGILSGNL